MPKALVAQTTRIRPDANPSCTRVRSASLRPAWYAAAMIPDAWSVAAAPSAFLRVAAYTSALRVPTSPGKDSIAFAVVANGPHSQLDVGPVEPRHDHARLNEAEQIDDVVANLRGRRGSKGRYRRAARKAVGTAAMCGSAAETPIVGSEVVAPLRHAMCLVDHEPCDLQRAEHVCEGCRRKSFRGHIQQAKIVDRSGQHLLTTPHRQHGVQRASTNPPPIQLVDLILHQRNQRRHDQRDAGQQEGRQLESERLPGSGGHDRQNVMPVHHGTNDVFLTRTKRRMPELTMKRRQNINHRRATDQMEKGPGLARAESRLLTNGGGA
jgi:hypothetical protein